jgi:Ran GTPase-activating protein (RanGAP) involved in mRNA processing and transport
MTPIKTLISSQNQYGIPLCDIDFNNETDDAIQKLAMFIKYHPCAEWITFRGTDVSALHYEKIKPVLSSIQENKKINKMSLAYTNFAQSSQTIITAFTECLSFMNTLDLSGNTIVSMDSSVEFLQNLSHTINIVEYNFNKIGLLHRATPQWDHMIKILNILAHNIRLNELFLEHNSIGFQENAEELLYPLFSGKIQNLDLSNNPLGCGISTENWALLFKSIENNPDLKSLNLTSCTILPYIDEDESNEPFFELLVIFVKNTKLKTLNLSNNEFPKDLTERLIRAACENPHLTFICDYNGLSKQEQEHIIQDYKTQQEINMELSQSMTAQISSFEAIIPVQSTVSPVMFLSIGKCTPVVQAATIARQPIIKT